MSRRETGAGKGVSGATGGKITSSGNPRCLGRDRGFPQPPMYPEAVRMTVPETGPPDAELYSDPLRATWLDGYEWALSHLTDPGVLADARRLALAHESAEAVREAPVAAVEPHGTYHGAPTPPVAPPPQSAPAPHPQGDTETRLAAWLDENGSVHTFDCDRFETYDYNTRSGTCDCDATEAITALFAAVTAPTACTCTILSGSTPWQPAEWEQAEDCPVHPMAAPAPTEAD